MIQFHKTPKILEKIYPALEWKKESLNELFLTFDDGPHPEITSWVLKELDRFDAKATFFCVGENLKLHPETAKKIVSTGHHIANHTKDHSKGWEIPNQDYFRNISACEEEINNVQQKENRLFRPPYGRIRKTQIEELKSKYQIIMWSHLSWDFDKNLNISKSIKSLKIAKPGSIIVFHDSEKSFDNLKILLPEVLTHWSSLNYKFSTL